MWMSSNIHITSNASFHLHITISHSSNSTSHRTILHVAPFLGQFSTASASRQRTIMNLASSRRHGIVFVSVLISLQLEANKTIVGYELLRPLISFSAKLLISLFHYVY